MSLSTQAGAETMRTADATP